ncbi:hypothetical protein CANARDRAFT_175977 [[Candida] arabinofermentans NRRL YB-2248]|uniref:Uncharacterized protein n=1 Tax=[Candida] arabinofermentans NRRL YB-2248 TaxID=983967 RepID=A0A1E4T1B9_9ASCO|nr:hypothetical protein CANARDRAFT_175977 [[Candida] arabinofermentans NRRL YB-2248]
MLTLQDFLLDSMRIDYDTVMTTVLQMKDVFILFNYIISLIIITPFLILIVSDLLLFAYRLLMESIGDQIKLASSKRKQASKMKSS